MANSGRNPGQEMHFRAGLRFWRWWFAVGVVMTLVVVYLSLANIHLPQVASTIGDKINHLIAYGALMGWFGQLFCVKKSRWLLAFYLVLLGILMEYLQSRTGYRHLDLFDAAANTLGVLLGMLALHKGADNILLWFEGRYVRGS